MTSLNEKEQSKQIDTGQCNFCGTSGRLLRCSRCKQAFYCSPNHQRLHWKTHKPHCKPVNQGDGGNHHTKPQAPTNTKTSAATSVIKQTPHTPQKIDWENNKHKDWENNKHKPLPLYAFREFDMSLDDYSITSSPAVHKSGSEGELTGRENTIKYAEYAVTSMINEGYCVIDNFLGESKAGKVLWDVISISRSGIMKPGELVAKGKNAKAKVRGDVITWITGQEEGYENMKLIMNEVDRLIRYCTGRLGNVKGRTPAMVACYPGNGNCYKRHIDNTTKDGRILSCLYYLNKGWSTEEFGGQLRLFPYERQEYVDIEPIFDRFCMFWSNRRTPHEVLPAYHQRFAVTLWYFDAAERAQVKETYFSNLKNAFASNVSVKNNHEKNEKEEDGETYGRVPTSSTNDEGDEKLKTENENEKT